MWISLLVVVLGQTPECHSSGGDVACGFYCRAELDEVKCAQTPQGVCTRVERTLTCWDPPDEVRFHADATTKPICKAKYRDVACGYSCMTSPTNLACAQTPWGVCAMRHDHVECWDPSPTVIHNFADSKDLAGAKCVTTDTGFACGWDCMVSYREPKCAQTPRGVCTINRGKISCFDPPLPPPTHAR